MRRDARFWHPGNVHLYTYNLKWFIHLLRFPLNTSHRREISVPPAAIDHLVGLFQLAMVVPGGPQFG
jgi:hypothetical protein